MDGVHRCGRLKVRARQHLQACSSILFREAEYLQRKMPVIPVWTRARNPGPPGRRNSKNDHSVMTIAVESAGKRIRVSPHSLFMPHSVKAVQPNFSLQLPASDVIISMLWSSPKLYGEMSEWSIVRHSKCRALHRASGSNPDLSAIQKTVPPAPCSCGTVFP